MLLYENSRQIVLPELDMESVWIARVADREELCWACNVQRPMAEKNPNSWLKNPNSNKTFHFDSSELKHERILWVFAPMER